MPFAFPNAGQRAEQKPPQAGGDFGRSVPGDGGGVLQSPVAGGRSLLPPRLQQAELQNPSQSTREFLFFFSFFFSAFKIIY